MSVLILDEINKKHPTPADCPSFGSKSQTTAVGIDTYNSKQNLYVCKYDPSSFDTDSIVDFQAKYDESMWADVPKKKPGLEVAGGHYCGQVSNEKMCPTDSSGKQFSSCSRFVSKGVDGDFCRAWSSTTNPKYVTDVMESYCIGNSTDSTCGCINRGNNPVYRKLKPTLPTSTSSCYPTDTNPINVDKCWWSMCQTDSYVIPPGVPKTTCSDGICTMVESNYKKSDISQEQFNKNVCCTSTSGKVGCGVTPIPPLPPVPPIPPIPPIPSFWSQYGWMIIGGIVLLVLVLAVIGLLIWYSRPAQPVMRKVACVPAQVVKKCAV